MTPEAGDSGRPLPELFRLFSRLGATAFGGPAAHIAMMHEEVVSRRRWLSDQRFLDLIGVTNLIPGPNSTEMAMHVGHERAGWRGLWVAGASFIFPAALIVLGFAWAYQRYGSTPTGESLLFGVKPVVVMVVAQALLKLARSAIRGWLTAFVLAAALISYLLGVHELLILATGAMIVLAVKGINWSAGVVVFPWGWAWLLGQTDAPGSIGLGRLFLVFLKVGAFLYGSGYVLLAFLQNDLVNRLQVLTEQQLLDAIAIGQFTPGPLFTTATFIGYVLAGVPGAVVATVGIFLPSFLLVGLVTPLARRIRDRKWTAALLDGVNAAALGLMAGVALQLAGDALADRVAAGLAVGSAFLLWKTRLNTAWLVLGGALTGLVIGAIEGSL